jgi:hypothetical protein
MTVALEQYTAQKESRLLANQTSIFSPVYYYSMQTNSRVQKET